MKKRKVICLLLILLVLVLPIFVDAKVEKISKAIMNAEENQKMRVVVHLKEDNSPKIIKPFSFSEPLISEDKINYKNKKNIFALLTKNEIEQLANSINVESITEEKKYQITLDESVPLINATTSWNLQTGGINLTGNGQTICIIDTGVNYSHPDLGGCFGENNVSSTCKIIGGWDYCSDDKNCMTEDSSPMDVHGHGTHVTGIAAANGTVTGVSPFSKVVMIKAGNSTGTFWESELKKAIDWCVANSSKFNISVISMSLGGGSYTEYCDEYSDGDNYPLGGDTVNLVSSINAAVAKNISVIAASGNNNNPNYISSPACIQNVTPVGNILKTDTFYTGFNRNWMVKILAPGVDIYSTYLLSKGSSYAYLDGTSMSTPHVAGAIAIIKQYLNLSGQSKTPEEIETILFNTGKQITDPENLSQNFSRIDVYSALLELDSTSPNVTLSSPLNNSVNVSLNQTFVCNSSDWQLKNTTLYLWNSSGLNYTETENISGTTNSTSFNVNGLSSGSYQWNCITSDVKSNNAFATNNFSLIIGGIHLSVVEPQNNTYTNINDTHFNCSATTSADRQLKNITFYLYKNDSLVNRTSVNLTETTNSTLFNYTFINETNYTWGCEVYSNSSDYESKNYTIFYDITSPSISTISESTTTDQVTISWNTSEDTNYSVTLQELQNSSFSQIHSLIIYGLSASTTYDYNLTYCDMAGNCNTSLENFRTADVPVVRSSGGGSGGGGSTPIKLTETQIAQGYSKKYSIGDKVSFVSGGQNHSLQLNRIINNSVNITIRSEPITLILQNAEERKINLSSSEYYDFYIKVENITKYNSNITIKKIEEWINPHNTIPYVNETETNLTEKGKQYEIFNKTSDQPRILLPLYALLILLFIIGVYFLLKRRFETRVKKKD